MVKKDEHLFPSHTADNDSTNQLAYGDCPECAAPLQIKFVGKNTFLGCTAYPKCHHSEPLNKQDLVIVKLIDASNCPQCDAQLAVKKGRYGMFIGCTDFPQCDFISNNQSTLHKPVATHAGDGDASDTQKENNPVTCPSCNKGRLLKKQNRFGKFFYACDNYPKCKTVFNQEPIAKTCAKCNGSIMLIKSRGENVFICADSSCAHVVNETNHE
jgi:putative DNA topoisomerase